MVTGFRVSPWRCPGHFASRPTISHLRKICRPWVPCSPPPHCRQSRLPHETPNGNLARRRKIRPQIPNTLYSPGTFSANTTCLTACPRNSNVPQRTVNSPQHHPQPAKPRPCSPHSSAFPNTGATISRPIHPVCLLFAIALTNANPSPPSTSYLTTMFNQAIHLRGGVLPLRFPLHCPHPRQHSTPSSTPLNPPHSTLQTTHLLYPRTSHIPQSPIPSNEPRS